MRPFGSLCAAFFSAALAVTGALYPPATGAQQASSDDGNAPEEDVVVYEAGFFDKYNPVTALDVVERTPGFSVSRQRRGNRGFGSASSNILINGERPSSKSDSVVDILSRLSADQVVRVELIRGATGGLDVQRQSVVANVVLRGRERGGSGFAQFGAELQSDRVNVDGELSYDGRLGPLDYLVGVERRAFDSEGIGIERLTRPSGTGQRREENALRSGEFWGASLRTETSLTPRDTLRFNAQFNHDPFESRETSNRFPLVGGAPDVVLEGSEATRNSFEIGGDYERRVGDTGLVQFIALARRNFGDRESTLDILPAEGDDERRESISDSTDGETIGRAEVDWVMGRHGLQLSGEMAHNFVDSDFRLFEDRGGGLVRVDVAGGDTRVSELRWEANAVDSWRFSPGWTLDAGLGFEVSTIRQSGDIARERTFTFAKPLVALTYSPSGVQQWRVRFQREVAQLDFFDFVSSVDFGDQELEFGNPELEPQRTWAFEATYERRFGEVGVLEVRGFLDLVREVQDLLPLRDTFEVPGNIGDGRKVGIDVDATVGLDRLGLSDSRLELGILAQDTSVTDPVTGEDRPLSGERHFGGRISYRQEFPELRLSYGVSYRDGAEETFFGLDELEIEDEEGELQLFVEKVVLDSFKLSFQAENLLNRVSTRERLVFAGPRDQGILLFRELRSRTEGRELSLSVSRTF